MNILQVNTADAGGGAESVSWQLHQRYRQRGHRSHLAVRTKYSDDPDVFEIPNNKYRTGVANYWIRAGDRLNPFLGKVRGAGRIRELVQRLGEPSRLRDVLAGREDFDYPATLHLLQLTPQIPDVMHCHNLHAEIFDLRELPKLSQSVPLILTLHDAWLLSGHCAHSFDCERWKTGCGECPDLRIPPAVWRDATAFNWQRKKQIYSQSSLYVATPCRWLMQKVQESILMPGTVELRVIPNGVNLATFCPAEKAAARAAIGLPQNAHVLLFVAKRPQRSVWKDYDTLRVAFGRVRTPSLLVVVGEVAPPQRVGAGEIRFFGYQSDSQSMARFYQAADVYVHAARADTFPTSVLEALACGTPVIATAVGGIPEQVTERTGILTPPGDGAAMATAIERLLGARALLHELSKNAAIDSRQRFSSERQAEDYLNWYEEILALRHQTCATNR